LSGRLDLIFHKLVLQEVVVAHICGEHQTTHYFVLQAVEAVVLMVGAREMALQGLKALQEPMEHQGV
jgi:hypothetical protein